MKFNSKKLIVSVGLTTAAFSILTGCQSTNNVLKTDNYSLSSDQLFDQYMKTGDASILTPVMKQTNIDLINKYYGSRDVDASKLLTRAKSTYGSKYLESIAEASGMVVKSDDQAKDALKYMELQKIFLEEHPNYYLTEYVIRNNYFATHPTEKSPTYSAKHVLVKTLDEAKKMKSDLESGKVDFKKLEKSSTDSKAKNEASVKASNEINVLEAATYDKQAIGQFAMAFEDAAFTQKVDAWGEPVLTQYGYHIIFISDRSDYKISDSDRNSLISSLKSKYTATRDANFNAIFNYAMISFQKEHKFSLNDDRLKKVYDEYNAQVGSAFQGALSSSNSTTGQ